MVKCSNCDKDLPYDDDIIFCEWCHRPYCKECVEIVDGILNNGQVTFCQHCIDNGWYDDYKAG